MVSPNINKVTMNFFDALKEVVSGRRITRIEWGDASVYGFLHGEWLCIRKDGKIHRWMVNDGDMLAEDWITLDTTVTAA